MPTCHRAALEYWNGALQGVSNSIYTKRTEMALPVPTKSFLAEPRHTLGLGESCLKLPVLCYAGNS